MTTYRKIPVEVEAEEFRTTSESWPQGVPLDVQPLPKDYPFGDKPGDPCKLCGCDGTTHQHGYIETLEGGHVVCPGDMVIRGVEGVYPCKPDIFEQTYEAVGEPDRPETVQPVEEDKCC